MRRTRALTNRVVCFKRSAFLIVRGSGLSQTTVAEKLRETAGRFDGETSISPRLRSISFSSCRVSDCGATARFQFPSKPTIAFTRVSCPEGSATSESPGRTEPLASCPANPLEMIKPISAALRCHSVTRTGRTTEIASTSKASNNVAVPTMILARTCQKVMGTRSSL